MQKTALPIRKVLDLGPPFFHRGWVKNFVVKVTLFLLALVNVWNFTQATLRKGWCFMIFVWTRRGKLLSNYWVWKLPFWSILLLIAGKFAAKFQKKQPHLWGVRCCDVAGGGGFPIFLFWSLILPSYLHTCPMLCFSNGIHFHLQWVGKLCMWVEKTHMLHPSSRRPSKVLCLAARSSDGRNSFWSHLAWWCAHQGSLEVVWKREVLPQGLTKNLSVFFFSSRKWLKEVAICWCCWWSLLNMTDSFFSHRPVLLRSWAPSHVAFLALIVIWKKRCYLLTRWQLNNRLNMTKDSLCGFEEKSQTFCDFMFGGCWPISEGTLML